jgi:hypothetical protein
VKWNPIQYVQNYLLNQIKCSTFFVESSEMESDSICAKLLAECFGFELLLEKKHSHSNLLQRIRGITKGEKIAFNGIFGGEILGGMALDIAKVDIDSADLLLFHLFSTEFLNRLTNTPKNSVRQFLDKIHISTEAGKKIFYYFSNSARSFLSTEQGIGWERPNFFFVGNGIFPFTDVSFLEQVLALPYDLTRGRRLYLDLMTKNFPDLMRIPWMSKPGDVRVYSQFKRQDGINYKQLDQRKHIAEYAETYEKLKVKGFPASQPILKDIAMLLRNSPDRERKLLIERLVIFELWNIVHGPLY